MYYYVILWMEEILHQLIGGNHPIVYRVSTILLVVYRIWQPSTVSYNPLGGKLCDWSYSWVRWVSKQTD